VIDSFIKAPIDQKKSSRFGGMTCIPFYEVD